MSWYTMLTVYEWNNGLWDKVMGWVGEKMARESSQQVLQNIKNLAESEARVGDAGGR